MMKKVLVKREKASELLLSMMIWAVFAILATRFYLSLTNNPKIAFGVWHIGHVLFGGLLMATALILMLGFHGREVRNKGAILGGLGWGLFIDEAGKFLTRDNNYWFRPAIIIIYISFIILFLIYRRWDKVKHHSDEAVFYSALEDMGEVADDDLEVSEKTRVLKQLKYLSLEAKNREIKKLAGDLIRSVEKLKTKDDKKQLRVVDLIGNASSLGYKKLFIGKVVYPALVFYSIYYAADKIRDTVSILMSKNRLETVSQYFASYDLFSRGDVYMISFKIISELTVAGFFLYGMWCLAKKKREKGLNYYRYGLLVSIFMVSVFRFYFEQFSAVFGLSLDILVFNWISMHQEELQLAVKKNK